MEMSDELLLSLRAALGTEPFGSLLVDYLQAKHADLAFIELGNRYVEEPRFEIAESPVVTGDRAVTKVFVNFTTKQVAGCCATASSTTIQATIKVMVTDDGVLEIETLDSGIYEVDQGY